MSQCRSSKQDENANTRVVAVGPNGHEELSNYAEDALKEVLGWYGLQEGAAPPGLSPGYNSPHINGKNRPPPQPTQGPPQSAQTQLTPTSQPTAYSTAPTSSMTWPTQPNRLQPNMSSMDVTESPQNAETDLKMGIMTDYGSSNSLARSTTPSNFCCKSDNPLDLTNGHATVADMGNSNGCTSKGSWSSQRKLIGMRFLFPPLNDDMLLFDRAKIWVRRHEYKYFVGWSEAELQTVDPILRPVGLITPDLYKMHMNRSEYCRNVKLKYCLEADTHWAKEFQEMLRKPASNGGFTGLCQAKIAAAELWRKYSEKYRSHQARYPNPKSKYKSKKYHDRSATGNESDTSSKRKLSADDSIDLEDEGTDDSQEAKRVHLDDEMDLMFDEEEEESIDPNKMHYESDECHEVGDVEHCRKSPEDASQPRQEVVANSEDQSSSPHMVHVLSPKETGGNPSCSDDQPAATCDGSSLESPMLSSGESMSGRAFFPHMTGAPFMPLPLPLYPGATSQFAMGLRGESPFTMEPPLPTRITVTDSPSSATTGFAKPRYNDRHHEYKRSERGLSFLFPSLSDHNLSLLDKVRITVLRHKNNYFLGKSEEDLVKVDPLIRPKMIVTSDIYKEYCHRNAMKYDSNLQFAMESPERWAVDFRAKLMRPPSEGGFSSLCEVKLEAGRLWREYSGKYRMHNIVKWQMDLNSTVKGPRPESSEGSSPGEKPGPRGSLSSQEGISPLPVSPSSDHDPRMTPSSIKMLSPQSSIESLDLSPATNRSVCDTDYTTLSRSLSSGAKTLSPKSVHLTPESVGSSTSVLDMSQDLHHQLTHSGRRSSYGKEVATKSQQELIYQLSQPPPGHKTKDPSVDNNKQIEASKSHRAETTSLPDALFRPLPRTMNVAEQVSIWLERHRHNYFLGYPEDDRTKLNEFLRPSIPVTREVFKRYVPESMVDIISKIELIMLSGEPWAVDFHEKINKEGGFATFEEALTEAVVLWNMAKTAYHHQQLLREGRGALTRSDYSTSPQQSPDVPLHLQSPNNRSIKTELESPSGPSLGSHQESFKCHTEAHQHVNVINKFEQSGSQMAQCVIKQSEPVSSQSVPVAGHQHTTEPRHKSTGSEPNRDPVPQSSTNLLDGMWALREQLQQQCADDPRASWVDKLDSHLPTLRSNLGPSYRPPSTTTNCIIDFVLSTLHQHVQHISSIVPQRSDSVQDGDNVVTESIS